ncbi:helix-turn-helix domain-containing protein [Thiomicrospira sp. ALE5]|uniref:helix-turn-helix domain-containing protein n=1 Tax=Thiomicrospira sp. ALE5 TaxID=748650 RepID=UPI00190ED172|nr:helix-turn-helix transcriptional regulator [Thiomicrospira sp. ALE5]
MAQKLKKDNAEWVRQVYLQIGQNVKKYRKEKGLSQVSLAHELGHESVGVVSTAEIGLNGKHFNIEHLAHIARILDVDVCCLLEGVNEICNPKSQPKK